MWRSGFCGKGAVVFGLSGRVVEGSEGSEVAGDRSRTHCRCAAYPRRGRRGGARGFRRGDVDPCGVQAGGVGCSTGLLAVEATRRGRGHGAAPVPAAVLCSVQSGARPVLHSVRPRPDLRRPSPPTASRRPDLCDVSDSNALGRVSAIGARSAEVWVDGEEWRGAGTFRPRVAYNRRGSRRAGR